MGHTDSKVVYRRYASLFFIAGCSSDDNELIVLEIVHRYVEQMDKYYGNVCELDIIFNFQKAYFILDELLLAGEMQESSKKNVLRCIGQQDSLEDMEVRETGLTLSSPHRSTSSSSVAGTSSTSYVCYFHGTFPLTLFVLIRWRMTVSRRSCDDNQALYPVNCIEIHDYKEVFFPRALMMLT